MLRSLVTVPCLTVHRDQWPVTTRYLGVMPERPESNPGYVDDATVIPKSVALSAALALPFALPIPCLKYLHQNA